MTDWFFCPLQEEEEEKGKGAEPLKQEVASLRLKLWQQEQDLGDALEKLRSSDRTKESLESFVLGQRESFFFFFFVFFGTDGSSWSGDEEQVVRCFFWIWSLILAEEP